MTEFKVRGADGRLRDLRSRTTQIIIGGKTLGCKVENDKESGEDILVCEKNKKEKTCKQKSTKWTAEIGLKIDAPFSLTPVYGNISREKTETQRGC